MANYFFYGTLCDPEIAREILGRPLSGCSPKPCALAGYKRVYVAGATYPGLIADPEGEVKGLQVYRISPLEASRLSRYEGREYTLEEKEVTLADGTKEMTNVFMPLPSLRLSDKEWQLDVWRRQEKRRFLGGLRRNVLV
ncbi:MAG: gamma-glutamylcyclotransferase [Rhodospirillales bacterium]|jgi:gamma-glutamylcyclotransferase (GGCT)/AIG2-like uncharacterized protein YtfP|nr:gamma-glutamylcyclotransferase [Rhodospirillales bacterium]